MTNLQENELIITCAVIGAEINSDVYPHLPEGTDELAESAVQAVESGASIVHLHVRDQEGRPSQNPDIFEEVTNKIRTRCDCIIQYSTGGAAGTSLEDRCAPLALKPDMATLSMGTINFGPGVFENSENTIKTIAGEIKKYSILPELEVFDYGMVESISRYVQREIVPEHHHINLVLGVPGGMSGNLRCLLMLTDQLKENQSWTVSGIGKYQLPLTAHAMAMGGHVRVGIEDNIYYRKGEYGKSNAQFVERVVRLAEEMDRPVATVEIARRLLGI